MGTHKVTSCLPAVHRLKTPKVPSHRSAQSPYRILRFGKMLELSQGTEIIPSLLGCDQKIFTMRSPCLHCRKARAAREGQCKMYVRGTIALDMMFGTRSTTMNFAVYQGRMGDDIVSHGCSEVTALSRSLQSESNVLEPCAYDRSSKKHNVRIFYGTGLIC